MVAICCVDALPTLAYLHVSVTFFSNKLTTIDCVSANKWAHYDDFYTSWKKISLSHSRSSIFEAINSNFSYSTQQRKISYVLKTKRKNDQCHISAFKTSNQSLNSMKYLIPMHKSMLNHIKIFHFFFSQCWKISANQIEKHMFKWGYDKTKTDASCRNSSCYLFQA